MSNKNQTSIIFSALIEQFVCIHFIELHHEITTTESTFKEVSNIIFYFFISLSQYFCCSSCYSHMLLCHVLSCYRIIFHYQSFCPTFPCFYKVFYGHELLIGPTSDNVCSNCYAKTIVHMVGIMWTSIATKRKSLALIVENK